MSDSDSGPDLMGCAVILGVAAAIALLIIAIYLCWRASELVLRVISHHWDVRAVQVAVISFLAIWLLAAVAILVAPGSAVAGVLLVLAVLACAALLIICRITELRFDFLYQRPWSWGSLKTDALEHSWREYV